jgi:hypothetical protein
MGLLSRWLVGEPGPGVEEERLLTHVYRLHQPEQGVPEGPLPLPRIDQVIDYTAR